MLTDYVNCSRNWFGRLLQIENQRSFDLCFKGATKRQKGYGAGRNIQQTLLLDVIEFLIPLYRFRKSPAQLTDRTPQ